MMAAIIAGVAGIAGLVLGRFWDYRSESLRWRRDQRVQSYQKLAEEFHIFHEAVRTVALLKPGSTDSELAISEARRTGLSWSKAMVAVWLHGSRRVVESSRLLDDCLTDLWRCLPGEADQPGGLDGDSVVDFCFNAKSYRGNPPGPKLRKPSSGDVSIS